MKKDPRHEFDNYMPPNNKFVPWPITTVTMEAQVKIYSAGFNRWRVEYACRTVGHVKRYVRGVYKIANKDGGDWKGKYPTLSQAAQAVIRSYACT